METLGFQCIDQVERFNNLKFENIDDEPPMEFRMIKCLKYNAIR